MPEARCSTEQKKKKSSPRCAACFSPCPREQTDSSRLLGRGAERHCPPPTASTNSATTYGDRPGGVTCNGEICDDTPVRRVKSRQEREDSFTLTPAANIASGRTSYQVPGTSLLYRYVVKVFFTCCSAWGFSMYRGLGAIAPLQGKNRPDRVSPLPHDEHAPK